MSLCSLHRLQTSNKQALLKYCKKDDDLVHEVIWCCSTVINGNEALGFTSFLWKIVSVATGEF